MTSYGQLCLDFAAAPDAAVAVPPDLVPASSPAAQPADGKAQQTTPERREFALKGLDGGNPLGFLAAVGALQSATAMEPAGDWRMWWQQDDGPWHPTLAGITDLAAEQLVERLADYLRAADNEALAIGKNLTISPDSFRELAQNAQDSADYAHRRRADFIAAFGCETAADAKGRVIQDTALRTMAGAGHQHFLDTMRQTVQQTGAEQLRRSLFEPWERKDRRLGLRWDPDEARRYALRWREPSGEPATTERGANRLAIEALPLLPTAIGGRGRQATLQTTGFKAERGRGVDFSWPLWTCPVTIATVASMLRLEGLRRQEPDHGKLAPLGIAAVYRSRRVTEGKQRNFMPATPV